MFQDLTIVGKIVFSARQFYTEGIYGVPESLRKCADAGMSPLYMPELAMARTNVNSDHILWEKVFLAPSVRVTGRTKSGTPVVVYAHVPTSLSDPSNIRKLIDESAFVKCAGPMPQDEFYSLLGQEGGGRVFVVDYNKLRESTLGLISVNDALAHPQTIPFLGGEKIAQAYLAKHRNFYGKYIGVWHSDDLKDRPMGRVLCLSFSHYGLGGSYVGVTGRFVGVAPVVLAAQKNGSPLEYIVSINDDGRTAIIGSKH